MEDTALRSLSHKLTHLIKDMSAVKFDALADFLMEQYHKKGIDVSELIEAQIEKAKANDREIDYDTAYEEVVASSMETMLADGRLVERLQELNKKDKNIVKRIAEYFKELARKIRAVYEKMTPVSTEGKLVAEMVEETERLQDLFFDALKDVAETGVSVNEGSGSSGVKYSDRNYFVEDKYFKPQMTKWKDLKHGDYVKVGTIGANHPIHAVGMPEGVIRYDVDKLKKNMADHGDYLTVSLLNAIPDIIAHPVAISEYKQENTISVFGNIFFKNSPMMVGVTISKDRAGNDISKVRTYNARRDVYNLITDDSILYLDENKKRTQEWFQACGIQVPLGGTKFGFIRSISQDTDSVNKKYSSRSSGRATLVSALEPLAQTEEERMILGEYKDSIDILNKTDKKLSRLRRQMDDLRYKKGKRTLEDAKALEELKKEAENLVNLVDLHDKKLLELEATKTLKKLVARERYQAAKEQKAEDRAKEQRARERRDIALRKSQIVRISDRFNTKLEANTKAKNIMDPLKGVAITSVTLAKRLFADVQENEDIIKDYSLVHLTAAEEGAVKYYRELLDKREAIVNKFREANERGREKRKIYDRIKHLPSYER